MANFKVTFKEKGINHECKREVYHVNNRQDVIDLFGLNESNIISYNIEEL